jgi:GH18 family chitinase
MNFYKNKKILILLSIFLLVMFLVAIGCCGKSPAPKPLPDADNQAEKQKEPAGKVMSPHIVLGYYENPWPNTPDTVGSLPSMKTFGKNLSAIAPDWYKATKTGELDSKYSKIGHDTAKSMNLKIYPLVTNERDATDILLGDAAVRTVLTDNLVKMVQENNYDGINIDFELLPPAHRDNLTSFMAELYPKMIAINKTLIISVFPQAGVTEDVSGAYDYANLVKNADYLQIMTYDNHWSKSNPGPIAPIGWYEDNIKNAIEKCGSPNKVIVGIGAYGYKWQDGVGETVTYVDAITLAEEKCVGILYDEKNQAPHFKYNGDNEVWFENAQSTEAKLNIIQKYQPAGIAIWRLGQEQPEIWSVIGNKFPKGNIPAKANNSGAANPPSGIAAPAPGTPILNPAPGANPPANPVPTP